MLKTVIVDDEILVLELLKNMLQQEKYIDIIGECTSPREALSEITALKPDLIFLDIEMPGINGIELATHLLGNMEDISIVFITAYDQYAVQAFRLNAIHYILKPPNPDEISQAIARVLSDKRVKPVKNLDKVYVRMLGDIQINGQTSAKLKWPTGKTEELFAMFLLSGANGLDKWTIIDRLWPDSQEGKREQLLYSTVYRLKKTLTEYGIKAKVINKLGAYKMEVEDMWLDVNEFENLYNDYKKTRNIESDTYEKLVELYRGQLFGSRHYEWSELYKYELFRKFDYLLTAYEVYCKQNNNMSQVKELQARRSLLEE
jgi:two-component SAPR family response regulator